VAFVRVSDAEENRDRAILFHFILPSLRYSRKAVLIADMLPLINRFPQKPLIYNIAWKTVIYLLLSAVIHYLERLIEFLARDGRLCRWQSKVAVGNRVAAFLGHPDHSLRPHRRVLHGARIGAVIGRKRCCAYSFGRARAGSVKDKLKDLTELTTKK